MSLEIGTRIGPYEITGVLGAGGMGEVYRARDTRLQREVAIKVLPASFTTDPERLARFEQEARAAAALNHPNILAVYDLGTHSDAPYIVSELLDGTTLREQIPGLPVRKAIDYAIQIARGLAVAHEKGIVHRDLKPENVFITADGRVKILDFGLAKLLQPEPMAAGMSMLPTTPVVQSPHTMSGVVMGTMGYMAPEQVRGVGVDHRADIFALGVILYEMLSGRRAFEGETAMDTMTAILKESPPDLPLNARQTPPALSRIVDKCMEKAPAARFQSASDLAFALEGASSMSGVAPAITGPPLARLGVRNAGIVAVVALMALAAAAYVAFVRAPRSIEPTRVSVLAPEGTRIVGSLALSPDGRTIVYTAFKADGSSALYAQTLDAADAKLLRGTESAIDPFFAPDGRSVGFFADQKLKRVGLADGVVETIAPALDPRGGAWSPDGVIVFAPNGGDGLYRVSADGGTIAAVTRLNAKAKDISHRWPRFLPDGKHFLFLERIASGGENRLFMATGSIDNPAEIRRIGPADATPVFYNGHIVFPREGSLFVQPFDVNALALSGSASPLAPDVWVSPNVDGLTALGAGGDVLAFRRTATEERPFFWVDLQGRQLGTVGPLNADAPRLSPDGRRLALSVNERRRASWVAGVWVVDLDRGSTARVTPVPQDDSQPVWSPDGSRIAFDSDRLGIFDLYVHALDGGSDTLVFKSSLWKWLDDWSPDGRWLLYEEINPISKRDLYVLPMGAAPAPVPVSRGAANEWFARFSPDGRWIAYVSDESGRDEVYVQAFPSGAQKRSLSTGGGTQPTWRRDGTALYYLSSDNHLVRVDVRTTGQTFAASSPVPLSQLPLYSRGNSQNSAWLYEPVADGSRFIVSMPNPSSRPSAIDLLIGHQ